MWYIKVGGAYIHANKPPPTFLSIIGSQNLTFPGETKWNFNWNWYITHQIPTIIGRSRSYWKKWAGLIFMQIRLRPLLSIIGSPNLIFPGERGQNFSWNWYNTLKIQQLLIVREVFEISGRGLHSCKWETAHVFQMFQLQIMIIIFPCGQGKNKLTQGITTAWKWQMFLHFNIFFKIHGIIVSSAPKHIMKWTEWYLYLWKLLISCVVIA